MSVKRSLVVLALLTPAIPAAIGYLSATGTSAQAAQATAGTNQVAAVQQQQPRQQQQPSSSSNNAGNAASQAAQTSSTVSALGTIEANQVVQLSFQSSGEIAELPVQTGDYVEAGTVIAQLDYTSAQVAYQQAQLNLENAQVSLQQLYAPVSDSDLRTAQANIASAEAAYNATANSVTASDLQAAQLRYQQAQIAYDAQVYTRTHMNGTDAQLTLQDAAVGSASFDQEIARLQLEKLQTPDNAGLWSASTRIASAKLQMESLLAGPTQAQIDTAELAVRRAQASLTDAETALKRTQIIAPISGVITAVLAEQGQSVGASTAVVEISDLSQLWLTAPINELDVSSVQVGMPATVQLDALPDVNFPATVEQIDWLSTVTNDIVNYNARVALTNTDPRIRVGMTAEAFIDTGSEGS